MPCRLHVVSRDEHLNSARPRRQDAGERVVGPRHPVRVAEARPDERLHERAVILGRAGVAREQDGVGAVFEVDIFADRLESDRLGPGFVEHLPPLHEPRGRGEIDLRRAEVGLRVVDVELLAGGVAVGHRHGLRPGHEVLGRGAGHRPAARAPLAVVPAVIEHVLPLRLAPKHRVAAVERVAEVAHELRLRIELAK